MLRDWVRVVVAVLVLQGMFWTKGEVTSAQTARDLPARRIAFVDEKGLWMLDEDGRYKDLAVPDKYGREPILKLFWERQGRFLAYQERDPTHYYSDLPVTSQVLSDKGTPHSPLPAYAQQWMPGVIGLIVSDKKENDDYDAKSDFRTSFYGLDLVDFGSEGKNLGRFAYYYASPLGRYSVFGDRVSEPVRISNGFVTDRYTHSLSVRKRLDGETIAELSQRWFGRPFWSYKEDKIAFFERDLDLNDKVVLKVFALPNDLLKTVDDIWENSFAAFLPDGNNLVYLDNTLHFSILNLESGSKETIDGPKYQFPVEDIPEGGIKLVEAGSKLLYNSLTFDNYPHGLFVYDFESKKLSKIVDDTIFVFSEAGGTIAYSRVEGGVFVTDLSGKDPKKIADSTATMIEVQPRIPWSKIKGTDFRALVLAQGIGTSVPEGYIDHDILPDYWPFIDEALDRGIYQDVIIYSYAGGKMRKQASSDIYTRWFPIQGDHWASLKSIKESEKILELTLLTYATAHPDVTYDMIGHSLGGRIEWQFLKDYWVADNRPALPRFKVDKVITLDSPLNGRKRDKVLELFLSSLPETLNSAAADELNKEAQDQTTQQYTEIANKKTLLLLNKTGSRLYDIASSDDCLVPQLGFYPYNSAIISVPGYLYKGLERKGVGIEDCMILDKITNDFVAFTQFSGQIVGFMDGINTATGHDAVLTDQRPWKDLRDLIVFMKEPSRLEK